VNIGQQIQELREKKGINQSTLAKSLGISSASMSAIEKGKNKPTYETLIAISDIFDVSIDYLLTGRKQTDSISEEEQKMLDVIRKDKELRDSINAVINFKKKAINRLNSYTMQGV
jgi:transcriptional regulator with XRE-family HTH domain